MTRRLLLIVVVLTTAASSWGQMTFKPGKGLKPGADDPREREEPDPRYGGAEYKQALGVYQSGKTAETIKRCDVLIKRYRTGPWVERAMLLKGRALFKRGDLKQADKTIVKFRKQFPGTALSREIAELQLAVGMAYLERGKRAGVTILREMVERNPYGPRADEAQFRIAKYYFGKQDYAEAAEAFALVTLQYRDSRYREESVFLRAKAMYLTNEGPRRDPLPYEEARVGLQEYVASYPRGKFVAEAQKLLKGIIDVLAQKQYLIAEYYRKQKKPRAAMRYYRQVVTKYPDSRWAALARKHVPAPPKQPKPEVKPTAPAKDAVEQPEKSGETKK